MRSPERARKRNLVHSWRPRLTVREAVAICGSLSRPSKMPGHGYALPASRCRLGSLLQLLPKAVCRHCYALRGRYVFPAVRAAMERRFQSLSDPRWVEAISTLILRSGDRHFRWHDSGDLQGLEHLEKIIQVCRNLPHVRFWLPTREYQTVEAYRRAEGRIPANLCIRYSAHVIDGPPPLNYGLPVSTVSGGAVHGTHDAHHCSAHRRANQCGRCRACWNPDVQIVNFPLK
jgi:protein gp88